MSKIAVPPPGAGADQRVAGSGAGMNLLMFIGSRFGIKGILIAGVGVIVLWQLGIVDPSKLLQGGAVSSGPSAPLVETAEEKELYEFVKVVLAGTEEVWAEEFARLGQTYTPPTLVV